jgi:hypothetical protein
MRPPKRTDPEVQTRHWLVPVRAYSHSSTRVLNPLYLLLLGLLVPLLTLTQNHRPNRER